MRAKYFVTIEMAIGALESECKFEGLPVIRYESLSDYMKTSTYHTRPKDVVIVVMGTTGAGKSSFIQQCTQDRAASIGHNLQSCKGLKQPKSWRLSNAKLTGTTRVAVHSTEIDGRTVHLIDTPGFNDTLRSDGETLQELAYWLIAASEHGFRLSGIVYLHCIADTRFHRSSQQSLDLFKAICGADAFRGAVIATTMWDRMTCDIDKANRRQSQLKEKIQEDMLPCGAKLWALSAAGVDAQKVIRHIVRKDLRLTLALQTEIVDRGYPLQETQAGKILYGDILRSFRRIDTSMDSYKEEAAAMLASLDVTCDKLRSSWEKRIHEEDEAFERVQKEYEDVLLLYQISDEQARSEEVPPTLPASAVDSTSDGDLGAELEHLRRLREGMMMRRRHRLDRRKYTAHGWGVTALSVVGTGLAVGQLVAAVSCNVM